jgi:succinate dehydrogenase / fumarate reductase, membrane anchor subunit
MVNRVVTGAHYGLRDWLVQRITAVIMVLYTLFLILLFGFRRHLDYAAWHALFASPLVKVATLLFVASVCMHVWVGVRDIYMDYVKPLGIRLALQAATVLVLAAYAGWALVILWRV